MAPPKSAPAHSEPAKGLQIQAQSHKLKFLRTRSNAVKEIEEWAKQGRANTHSDVAIGRNSGTQLSDNVTEERMLQARLMELSKERYKFIHQMSYEKKMFLDRQQRKSAALKDKLKNVSLDNSRYKSAKDASRRVSTSVGTKRRRSRHRIQQRGRGGGYDDEVERPHTVPPRLEEISQPAIPPLTPPIFQTEPLIPDAKPGGAASRYSGPGEGGLPRLTTPSRRASSSVKASRTDEASRPDSKPVSRRSKTAGPGVSFLGMAGESFGEGGGRGVKKENKASSTPKATAVVLEHPVDDARYRDLELSLCENYDKKTDDVTDIIGRMDSLSVRGAGGRDHAKPKLALKAYQFLSERGIIVNM